MLGIPYARCTSHPISEDTVIDANVINISNFGPGRIVSINITENGEVRCGELMFRIDLYQLRVAQAQAELKIAETARESQHRTVVAEQSNAAVTSVSISRARANLKLEIQILARHKLLLAKGYVSTYLIV
ncbi:biotin/lipoyl-binding protein [Klebsiella variicola]|uniref:biotin/lipoyl-binding protein n=1 Tax=Klebsiella variicola TaxID=244366 RepID=UPI003D956574